MQAKDQSSVARFGGQKGAQGRDNQRQTIQAMSENPSPPSPTLTQSTLTQSGSTSNSASSPSTSPPHPITPPRTGRTRRHYGELGRVPLHRRGTSQTYERLEDLLREAGYKETRIFTPETDRTRAGEDGEDCNEQDQKGPIGALVNFISGLMPSAAASRASLISSPEDDFVPSPLTRQNTEDSSRSCKSPLTWSSPTISPLSNRRQLQNSSESQQYSARYSAGTPPPTSPPGTMTPSLDSLEFTPKPPHRQMPLRTGTPPLSAASRHDLQLQLQHPSPRRLAPNDILGEGFTRPSHLRQQESRTSLMPQESNLVSPPGASNPYKSTSQIPLAYPMPSKAGAYLRHIASTPHISRPNSTPVGSDRRKKTSARKVLVLNDTDNEDEDPPPMPKTWLESVAKAVLFGGFGSHAGGPTSSDGPSSASAVTSRHKTLRQTRSSLSQASPQRRRARTQPQGGIFFNRTNSAIEERDAERNSQFLAPPDIFLRFGSKASATTTEAKTRVVCRSAPTSRATSRVRGSPGERRSDRAGEVGGKAKERVGRRPSWKGSKRPEKDRVPSLANTDVEGDDDLPWSPRGNKYRRTKDGRDRISGGWTGSPGFSLGMKKALGDEDQDMASPSEGDEDEEDEEDEIMDLARILVPPKRQNSIKSLRKHLEGALDSDPGEIVGPGRERMRGRAASGQRPAGDAAKGTKPSRTRSGNSSAGGMEYDGAQADECQWGRGWVKGGGGARGRRSTGDDEERHNVGLHMGEEFYERGFERGGKFDSGRSAKSGRAGLPGVWGA